MTYKQDNFITRLVGERYKGLGAATAGEAMAAIPLASMAPKQKGTLIDRLLEMPTDPVDGMPEHVAECSRKGPNDSPGRCDGCGHTVERHAGFFYGPFPTGKRWKVHHKLGGCSDTPAPEPVEVTEGFYVSADGETYIMAYRTQHGRIGGKVWNGARWQYQKGAVHLAGAGSRITAEQAKAFAALTGKCIFCSRELTDERSVEVGYGPTCAGKNGLPWG